MGAPKGTKHTDETRKKMSLAHIGQKLMVDKRRSKNNE